jgi:hypothetical protein
MIEQIKLFLFVLSVVFTLRFVSEFVLKLFQEEPQPMKINSVKETFIYIALAYIITFIII